MEEHLLTRLNRDRVPSDTVLDPIDLRPSVRPRRKPVLTGRRLLVGSVVLLALAACAGSVYVVFVVAQYFWRMVFDPHRQVATREQYPNPWYVQSYYGGHAPQFDVVASVFVRYGQGFPDIRNRSAHFAFMMNPEEETAFSEWQSLYSEVVFSRISLNSTAKKFEKTVDLTIPPEVLSQFYKPHTFFPQIVYTFVVVPSDPDPMVNRTDALQVATLEGRSWRGMEPRPKSASWTEHRLDQIARPVDFHPDGIEGGSRLENNTWSLDAFYDYGAARELALGAVGDKWSTWSWQSLYYHESDQMNRTRTSEEMADELDISMQLAVRRNATLKIRTRSWLSVIRETPQYNPRQYDVNRRAVSSHWPWHRPDRLNSFFRLVSYPFSTIGHYGSYIGPYYNVSDRITKTPPYYGPYMTLHEHAAGSDDWAVLPKTNRSSDLNLAPSIISWHITLDLLSNMKMIAVDAINQDRFGWIGRYEGHRFYYGNDAYMEAKTLQAADFINAVLGNSRTSSKRPVLRSVFIVIGGFVQYAVGFALQAYYMFTLSVSTGLSLPAMMLYLLYSTLYEAVSFWSHWYDTQTSTRLFVTVETVHVLSIWRWACLWWGIGFTWTGWGGRSRRGSWDTLSGWDGWAGLIPVRLQRFGQTHSERTSRRADQKFTWIHRGVFVVISTIILTHLPELPHLISSTHLQDPDMVIQSYYDIPPEFHQTIWTWSETLRLSKYGASLRTSLSTMAVLAQVMLNWRSGTFAGSFPSFAWTQVVGTIFWWTPTVLESIFGKLHATEPLAISVAARFIIDLVVLWQAVSLPTVRREEDEENE